MTTNRREFIEHLGATAMLGALPLTTLPSLMQGLEPAAAGASEEFDFTWPNKLKGKKLKAVFDCAEVEKGYGVWRAGMWEGQYQQTQGYKPNDTITVLVLRHDALVLAFKQDLWAKYGIGPDMRVEHPITQQSTSITPALLSSTRNEIAPMFDAFALPNFIARGGVVLACNVALQFFSQKVASKSGQTVDDVRKEAIANFLPGVTLQPSGVFAAVKAQESGCVYVRAS